MGLKKIYLVGYVIKKAEMELRFQKSGFDLSSAFYKMRTSGKIFTFHVTCLKLSFLTYKTMRIIIYLTGFLLDSNEKMKIRMLCKL